MYGQGVRNGFLVHLYFVRIVNDDIELSEPSIVVHERRRLHCTVVDVTMSVHVGDDLSVTRVPQQLHGVRDDGLVCVDVSLDVRHLEAVVHIPLQQRRGEQDRVASITAHEHAPWSRHDVVLFGVSAHERSEFVACQTDVLEHVLHLGKVFA